LRLFCVLQIVGNDVVRAQPVANLVHVFLTESSHQLPFFLIPSIATLLAFHHDLAGNETAPVHDLIVDRLVHSISRKTVTARHDGCSSFSSPDLNHGIVHSDSLGLDKFSLDLLERDTVAV
jgi:hypothetical protein